MIRLNKQANAWEHNSKELNRLGINYEGKAVLAFGADLYFPFAYDINVTVFYQKKDGETVYLQKTLANGTPYPNKNYRSAQVRLGRKKTRNFIPLVFENLNELSKIQRVTVIWDFPNVEFIITDYFISFDPPAQKGIYAIKTRDVPFFSVTANNEHYEKMSKIVVNDEGLIETYNGSVYDDVVFAVVCNNQIAVIDEFHSSRNDLDMDSLFQFKEENSPILQCVIEQIGYNLRHNKDQEPLSEPISITYYRKTARLNDESFMI